MGVEGFIGNFTATINKKKKTESLKIGTIVVAVGADELKPQKMLGYGRFDNVITQLEFEQRYGNNFDGLKRVVMINCAGAPGGRVTPVRPASLSVSRTSCWCDMGSTT